MVSMAVVHAGPYKVADLERERDRQGLVRWELLDGELVVTPSPLPIHQQMLRRLLGAIAAVVDDSYRDLEVFSAPMDLRLSPWTVLQPDIWVVPLTAVGEKEVEPEPLLAVEILSPSTRRHDLVGKKGLLEESGCPHYWVLDPQDVSIRMWELVGGAYVLRRHATGDDVVRIEHPIAMTFRVSQFMPPGR